MFTATQHQGLMHECMEWDVSLKSLRDNMTDWKNELYTIASSISDPNKKIKIEHFHNQFHIQMINLHDLIHLIEKHMKVADEHPTYRFKEPHQALREKYEGLVKLIGDLEREFKDFAR